jgi:hypothetical protein
MPKPRIIRVEVCRNFHGNKPYVLVEIDPATVYFPSPYYYLGERPANARFEIYVITEDNKSHYLTTNRTGVAYEVASLSSYKGQRVKFYVKILTTGEEGDPTDWIYIPTATEVDGYPFICPLISKPNFWDGNLLYTEDLKIGLEIKTDGIPQDGFTVYLDGSEVYRNWQYSGRTLYIYTKDITIPVPEGEHKIQIKGVFVKDGVLRETILSGNTYIKMVKIANRLIHIFSNPSGAQIWLDDRNLEVSTPNNIITTPERHKVTLKKEGYYDYTTYVDTSERDAYVSATLEPLPSPPPSPPPSQPPPSPPPRKIPQPPSETQPVEEEKKFDVKKLALPIGIILGTILLLLIISKTTKKGGQNV